MRPLLAMSLALALAIALPGAALSQGTGNAPAGFEPAFDDGRLNPARGPRALAGNQLTDQVWSREVPRRSAPYANLSGPAAKSSAGPPRGYEFAFDDGRLNPERMRGSATGQARMGQVWSDTVPRRVLPGNDLSR